MSDIKMYALGLVASALGSYSGVESLSHVADYFATKTAVLQAQLSHAPALTDVVIKEANQLAENAANGDLDRAISYGVLAGITFAIAAYAIINANKD